MNMLLIVAMILGGIALLLRWRRPAWYWFTVAAPVTLVRVVVRYNAVMEACEMAVAPSRMRAVLARATTERLSHRRTPRILRVKVTRAGVVLRLRLRPGQDVNDIASCADRLRHGFAVRDVTCREVRPGVIELWMLGYDVLHRVQMPACRTDLLRLPVALCETGGVHYRDYRQVPHALNIGATQSGKSAYQRRLVTLLAEQDVALVGIDCKNGVELSPLARRFSALAATPDEAVGLLEALVDRMAGIYQIIRDEQRISSDVTDAEITADIWGLPGSSRPVPIVVLIDEVAELSLVASKAEEKRRARIITALVRLVQLGRAAGIYVDICGQRFGSDLGDGITLLRAQLTGRTAHRVNDEASAKMAFADISPDAVAATTQLPTDRPGMAVAGDSSGSWVRTRTPYITLREAATICNRHADRTPIVPELADWRPALASPMAVQADAVDEAA